MGRQPARPPTARRTDNFSKSDNNTLRQIRAEGKNPENIDKIVIFLVFLLLINGLTTSWKFACVLWKMK